MALRRSRGEQERLSETQQACGTKAEEYTLLALRTTDPIVREGARQMAAASNRNAGQTLMESLADPDNEVTPEMRAARQALQDGA
ncbi:hypothetical protein [Actinomadura mexicana]|uniref:HEAT repeat-containing protein n=1 Tax=Actinomadura mexicana TaxID=134959 RepID=A0A238WZE9_9ACTN|nr:hypothetical protein [Actinomadura mexicana]SNR51822.1 hypothetical protein SAMN06265355_103490 [Actinomadura mexicana]